METSNNNKKDIKSTPRKAVIIAVIAIMACALIFFFSVLSKSGDQVQTEETSDENNSIQIEDAVTPDPEKEEAQSEIKNGDTVIFQVNSDIEIPTPYCTLHYPQEWSDKLKVVAYETQDVYRIYFVGLVENNEVPLYAISFGESSEMPLGTLLQDDGSSITVHLNLELFSPDDGWTAAVSETASEMVSDSSYTVEEISLLDNFS